MAKQASGLGKFLGVLGFISGLFLGYDITRSFWGVVIFAIILAAVGVGLGNWLTSLFQKVIATALSLMFFLFANPFGRAILSGALNSQSRQQQSRTISPKSFSTTESSTAPSRQLSVTPTRATIKALGANLRPSPDRGNQPVLELQRGDELELLSPDHNGSGWYHVRHPRTGQKGWIHGDNIDLD